MQWSSTPSRLIILASLTASLALFVGADAARAQSAGPTSGAPSMPQPGTTDSFTKGPTTIAPPPEAAKPERAPAPVLPGAATRSDRVAPATGTAIADPNAALFDAINRGDIASARDALDRGADLDAHNVLGMTPLDLSVDLGRNDITFLLLSLRNGDIPTGSHAPASTARAMLGGKPAPTGPGGKPIPTGAKPASTRVATRAPATSVRPVAPVAPATPRLFAGDGGTPNPTAGFLGFDNRH